MGGRAYLIDVEFTAGARVSHTKAETTETFISATSLRVVERSSADTSGGYREKSKETIVVGFSRQYAETIKTKARVCNRIEYIKNFPPHIKVLDILW